MYSVNGYRRYSRDVDNAFNIIPSDRISMKGVDFPVIGVDEFGIIQFIQPEKEYRFPGNTVFEVPIMERGGWLPSRDKVKATLNPKNWGVPDYSDKGDFAGGSHNAQSQTKKPVTQTNDKRDYIAENNISYQWSDAPINTTPLLVPSAYKTTQGGSNSEINPIEEQLRLAKLASETLDSVYEDQLRALYNTTPHQVLYKYDKDYRDRMDYNASQNPYKIQYPKTDLRRGDNIPPNTAWMYPNLTGQIGAAMTTQANQDLAFDIMGAGMASKYFKGAKGVNNIAKVFKPAKRVDDIAKVSIDFKIEDVLKNIFSDERKNMEIIKKGNAYFKELNNPESLKRLKEFGDEYGIDLLDAYKKAEQRWDYGKNIGEHSKFKVKKTDEDWYGLSTIDWDYEDQLKIFDLENRFGKDSKQVKDFRKKLSQEKSINYISDDVPLDRYEKTVWHELSHDINKSIIESSPKLQEDIKNIFIKRGTADLNKIKKGREYVAKDFYTKKDDVLKDLNNPGKLQKIGEDEFDYVTKPTETWAFLSTNLRQDLKNTGIIKNYNELLTPEKLEKAIKNGNTVFSRFEPYIKDKDAFIKLFNKMTLSIAPAVLYLQSQNQNKSIANKATDLGKGEIKAFTTIPIGIGTAGTVGASQQKYQQGGSIPPIFVDSLDDPRYKSYQDSLKLYKTSEIGRKVMSDEFDWIKYSDEVIPYDKLKKHINKIIPPGESWKMGQLIHGKYTLHNINKDKKVGNYEYVDDIKDYESRTLPIKPIGWKAELNYGEKYDPEKLYIYHAVYKKPEQPVFVKGTQEAINAEKQIMLKEQGLYSGKIDGDWGRLSKAAWCKYQASQQTKDTMPPAPEIKVGQPVQQQKAIIQEQVISPKTKPVIQERPQKYYKNVRGVITEVDKDAVGAMTYEEAVNKNKPKKTLSGKTWGYTMPRQDIDYLSHQQGGTVRMDGMMKARLALDSHFGNPTARRMTNYDTRNYKFDDGSVGNVYVSSYDNLVTPHIQLDENNNLIYVDDVWSDNNKERSYQQSMKFEREEDAEYFGKNYKRVAPMKKLYQDGGYIQEEDPTTQLLYSIAEALQQGSDPREVLNALKQNGVPEEQAMELIKYVMEQMQQQAQLQKEEKQQLEYAQDGKIVRKYNVEDLDWSKGINRAMLAFNMLQTPGLWHAPVKHGVLDALNAGLGLAAGLSGVGLGYSKLGAKKEYLGTKGLDTAIIDKNPNAQIQAPYIGTDSEKELSNKIPISQGAFSMIPGTENPLYNGNPNIQGTNQYSTYKQDLGTKGLEPMKKLTTSEVAQTPEITAENMTKRPPESIKPSNSDMSFSDHFITDNLNQLYNKYFGKQLSDFRNANSENINTLKNLYPNIIDLVTKQDGGYVQEEDPTTQLLYSIAEALQQGSDPREILNALKQNGVPEEQAMELIKYVMEQMQQQDQLQKEEKQQLEYAQNGKIVRKPTSENLTWDWQTQYPDLTAANMTGTNQLVSSVNMTGTNQLVSSPYIPEGKDVTKDVKPSSEIPTWDWQTQHPVSKEEQTKTEDNVKNKETKQTFYTGDPYGMLMANNALIGFQKFNDYLSDKDYEREYNRRMMQIGNSNAKYNPVNYDNPYGTYTPNVGIGSNYGLVANGPIQDFGTGMFMAEEGGRLPQMPNGGRGIVTNKTVDPNRKKTVDVSNEKSNKTSGPFGYIRETVRNLDEPLVGKPYYFNGVPYKYNPAASEGRKLAFIPFSPDHGGKPIDVDIVDFNKALNKDQIVNNYYQKYYPASNAILQLTDDRPDISKLKLERYYVSDNEENAKSYEDPDFYTFRGKGSEYKVPNYLNEDTYRLNVPKNHMDRVIQKDSKLYYLYTSFLEDIPYFEEEPQYTRHASNYGFHDTRDGDWYKVGFKSVPKVYAVPLDSNYEPDYDQYKIFDENDLRNAKLAYNPFAKKKEEIVEEEIVEEEPTNTNKTTTTTQSSSKNNTSGKSTTQKDDYMTRKRAKMFF